MLQIYLDKIRRLRHSKGGLARIVIGSLAAAALLLVVGFAIFYQAVASGLPDVTKLNSYDSAQTTKVYARDGSLVATLFEENRTPVELKDVSPFMQQALVAVEDARFYEHEGVDFKGIARAALGNFHSGEVQQGASTLTMQLARRLFLSDERSYSRKLREAVLARQIDQTLSKEKILELYLNEVYFGSGAYGIDAAASRYFGINPSELTLWQSAILAGLVQAPSAYSPLVDKKAALARADEVLTALVREGKISEQQKNQALQSADEHMFVDHGGKTGDGMLKHPYFTTYAIQQLSNHFPENYIRRGGLHVYTTLDPALQEAAEASLKTEIHGPGRQLGADTGAVVVVDNETGQLRAMVGGPEWTPDNQYNRAWQAKRQPGSAFKVFVYTAALEAGYTPEHEFADTEAVFNYDSPNSWKPSNSDGKFRGPIPMRAGLQFSRNLVAAKVMAHLGTSKVSALAHRMGIEQELPQVASLALGAGEISPLEMARAFSVFPNGGVLKANTVLLKVTDSEGEVLKDFSKEKASESRIVGIETASQMCEMLSRVVAAGTGTGASVPGTFVAGKTGTTDKFIDAWFVGFNPKFTISVWVGRDDNKPMGRVYGGTLPANVFHDVMEKAVAVHGPGASLPGVDFGKPVSKELCWDSMYLALPNCKKTYTDTFATSAVPTRDCPTHRSRKITKLPEKVNGAYTNLEEDDTFIVTQNEEKKEDSKVDKDLSDSRMDPEVVTPRGALIPYQEKEPETEVKIIEIEVEKDYPTTVEQDTVEGDTDFVVERSEDDSQVIITNQPDSLELETTPEYPTSNESSNEVIYENDDVEIPSSPQEDVVPPEKP